MAKFTFHYETDNFFAFRDEIASMAQAMGMLPKTPYLSPAELETIKAQGPGPAVTTAWKAAMGAGSAFSAEPPEPQTTADAAAKYAAIEEARQDDDALVATEKAEDAAEPAKARKGRKAKEAAPAPVAVEVGIGLTPAGEDAAMAEVKAEAKAKAAAKGNGHGEPIALPEKIGQDELVKLLRRYDKTFGYNALAEDAKATLLSVANVSAIGKLPQDRETMEKVFIALSLLNINNPYKRVPVNEQ